MVASDHTECTKSHLIGDESKCHESCRILPWENRGHKPSGLGGMMIAVVRQADRGV